MDTAELILYNKLTLLGEFYSLNIQVSERIFFEEIKALKGQWHIYNRKKSEYKREGLSLISLDGSTDGRREFNSLVTYNKDNGTELNEMSFRVPTENWFKLGAISGKLSFLQPYLGRSQLVRLVQGGFFPPHRDIGNSFRLISFLGCSSAGAPLILNGKLIKYNTGVVYFMDTRLEHSFFNTDVDNHAIILILNVNICEEAVNLVYKNLLHF